MEDAQPTVDDLRRSARGHRNMRPVVVGQAVSLFGDYVAYFTLPWLVLSLTDRPLFLGLTFVAETVPLLLFGFASGVLLDRANIRRVLVLTDGVRAMVFVLLAIAVAADIVTPAMIFVAAFLTGTMAVLFDSGLYSMLPVVVGEDLMITANARLSAARNIAFSLGPAVAGLLVFQSGFAAAFVVNALTFLVSAVFLVQVRYLRQRERYKGPGFTDALTKGVKFISSQPHLRWVTAGAAISNLVFAPLEALIVLFIRDELSGQLQLPGAFDDWFGGAAEVGLFIGVQAAIGAAGVLLAPRVINALGLGATYLSGLALFGGGFLMFAFSGNFLAVIPAGLALIGLGWTNVAFITMRQELTPEELLGRVMATTRTLSYLFIPIGAFVGAVVAEEVGLVPVYIVGSSLVLVTAALLALGPLGKKPIKPR